MKNMFDGFGAILVMLGWALLVLANVTAIGVGLYDWAFNTTLAIAAWEAFVLWIKMMAGGFVSLVTGMILLNGKVKITRK